MLYLHAGAHKTATTYLQDLFWLNRAKIARSGRAYWSPKEIRPCIEYGIFAASRRKAFRLPFLRTRSQQHPGPFGSLQDKIGAGLASSIVSDENIIGHASDALGGQFYIRAKQRLGYVRSAIGGREAEIWLSLRAYPAFLASMYAEALRHGYAVPISSFIARNQDPAGQWPAFLRLVHEVFPSSKLVVWAYEDFEALEPRVVERLSGVSPSELRPLPPSDVRPSPSGRCVETQSERVLQMQRPERILSMAMLEEQFPLSQFPEKFDPWPKSKSDEMQLAYERDLRTISALSYVEFLRP